MSELISDREQTARASVLSVGSKAAALARLHEWGFRVPDFFVVRSEAFAKHLTTNRLPWPPPGGACTAAHMPEEIFGEVGASYDHLTSARVAVRSSGADEDSEQDSFAGQFDSILGVSGHSRVCDAIKQCWASAASQRSIAYRAVRGLPLGDQPNFGVIVQAQVYAQKAGVLFTVHPMDPKCAYLEANFGTGESVVGSLVTPDGITISRAGGTVVEARIAAKRRMTVVSHESEGSSLVEIEETMRRQPVLTTAEAEELFTLAAGIEERAGRPQDIEWAIDDEGIWILQARPITASAGGEL